MRVCAHCGELYDEKRLNCPHCGTDADVTWVRDEPPHEHYEGWSERDDADYQAFLEEEGMLEPPASSARPYSPRVVILILLLIVAISGIIGILL